MGLFDKILRTKETLRIGIVIVIMFLLAGGAGAVPAKEWTKTFGGWFNDEANSVQQTSDGGYIVVGQTESYRTSVADLWLIKINQNGIEQWNKTFPGSYKNGSFVGTFIGSSVKQTSDGGYVIAGTLSNGYVRDDALLIKSDAEGNIQWVQTFGRGGDEYGYYAQQTSDGGYIVALGPFDGWLIKTYSNGTEEWSKRFGGKDDDNAPFVQQTSDGGFIAAGQTESIGAGLGDGWLTKFSSNGNIQWSKAFGGKSWDSYSEVKQTSDGGYIAAGITNSNAWLTKTDQNGNEQWNRTYGKGNAKHVQRVPDGGYLVGVVDGDARFIKTDANGNEQWNKTIGRTDKDNYLDVQSTLDGGYIVAGWTESSGNKDVLLKKIGGGNSQKDIVSTQTPTASPTKTITEDSTQTPIASQTEIQTEIPKVTPAETPKTSGFEIVLSITTLSILYVLLRKRR